MNISHLVKWQNHLQKVPGVKTRWSRSRDSAMSRWWFQVFLIFTPKNWELILGDVLRLLVFPKKILLLLLM